MKAVIQRVACATVTVDSAPAGKIGNGLLILLGISKSDTRAQAERLASKIAVLRIFADPAGKLNLSLLDVSGSALVVSNFTLCADCRRGHRPDFGAAAPYGQAKELYDYFCLCMKESGVRRVETGRFGEDMRVELANDGPVTLVVDTDDLS